MSFRLWFLQRWQEWNSKGISDIPATNPAAIYTYSFVYRCVFLSVCLTVRDPLSPIGREKILDEFLPY